MPPHHRRAAPPTLLFHLGLGTPRDVSPSPRPVLTARLSYPYRRSSRSTWTRTGATRRCTSPKKPSAPSDGTPSCRRAERRSLTHSISGDVNTNGNSASGASASTSGDAFGRRTLDAVVRVLEARAVRGAEGCRVAGAETSRTIPDEERELNALVAVSLFLSSYVQLV